MEIHEIVSARFASRGSAYDRPALLGSRALLLLGRIRFQLIGGLLFGTVMPAALRNGLESLMDAELGYNSFLVTVWAFLLGYLMFRKVTAYPGVRATAYIIPTFALAYLITVAVFFIMRFQYSRYQFIASFVLTILFFLVVFLIVSRTKRLKLAVVPGGDVSCLSFLRNVDCVALSHPEDAKGSIPLVADLRADLDPKWERFITDSVLKGRPVFNAKDVFESVAGRVQVEHLSENSFGSLAPSSLYASGKRYVDFLLALCALVVLSPLLILAAIAIRIDSRGPAIFRQARIGFGGKPFIVYKFRTMKHATSRQDAERTMRDGDMRIAAMTAKNDPRITKIGRFFRRSRIDEVPQIINILRGDMSWIGPRPEAVELSEWYATKIPYYLYRHMVRPGVTGWAQVNQGHVTSIEDVDLKLQYDFFYVKNFSFWLDALVLMQTLRIIITGHGAK